MKKGLLNQVTMDKRVIKTKRNIEESFFRLAYKKGIDQISVKSLCEEALINKATFYSHYEGLHELIEEIEDKVIAEIISINPVNELDINNAEAFLMNMVKSFSKSKKDKIFLSSTRQAVFIEKLYASIKKEFYLRFPKYSSIEGFETTFCFLFNGLVGINRFNKDKNLPSSSTFTLLGEAITTILKKYE